MISGIRRHPLWAIVETFSAISGAAFVVSGVVNAVVFLVAWRLNYFLIASPSDVIMSGFIFFIIFALATLVAAIPVVAVTSGNRAFDRMIERNEKTIEGIYDKEITAIEVEAGTLSPEELKSKISDVVQGRFKGFYRTRWLLMAPILGRVAIRMAWMVPAVGVLNLIVSSAGGNPLSLISAFKPFFYETGLSVSPNSTIGGHKCAGAHVAWLGSSAAILECSDGVHVIHKLDTLETVPRF